MRFRPAALFASLLVGSTAYAQTTTTVKITSPGIGTAVTSGGAAASYPAGTPNFYVSPYAGLLNYDQATGTGTSVSLNCVDYFHEVYVGDVWTANVTNLGAASSNLNLLSNTRYGHFADPSSPYDALAYGNVLQLYKQAAWLTLQYDANPGSTPDKTRAIQSAIWTLFNGLDGSAADGPWFNGTGTTMNDSQWWVVESGKAQNQLATADLQYFSVITDNTSPWASDSKQEFLVHTTPEPSTIILMLTGGIALLVVVRRRQRNGSALEAA
jgi:hypothetical protein